MNTEVGHLIPAQPPNREMTTMTTQDYDGPILEIENLSISFFTRLREIPAVMDFSVTVQPGEAVGLVGESGCGKSTVALGVMQDLGKNGSVVGGTIKFKGQDLNLMSPEDLRIQLEQTKSRLADSMERSALSRKHVDEQAEKMATSYYEVQHEKQRSNSSALIQSGMQIASSFISNHVSYHNTF
jgi:ABC-type glutathione transport system ATPase component